VIEYTSSSLLDGRFKHTMASSYLPNLSAQMDGLL